MILRKVIPGLIVCSCLSPSAPAQEFSSAKSPTTASSSTTEHTQDFKEIVVPITSVWLTPSAKLSIRGKLGPTLDVDARFGTGFCLDAACRFIVTNYHVAVSARTHKIKGEKIIQRYMATGPHDQGATANFVQNGVLAYATKRDLAIFELQHPLPHHHGLTFTLDELEIGQEVDIYGYPKGMINPIRKLTRFPATFKAPTTSGLLAFDYELPSVHIQGASGGIVIDRKTEKIVGILCATTDTIAVAVPVQTLADFVSKVQPFLAQKIFPTTKDVSPVAADIYPKFQPPPNFYSKFVPSHAGVLQQRPEEPNEVSLLRKKAQLLADSMRNFIAVQSFSWGSADKEPAAQAEYEVRVIEGNQRFRSYPDGKKESARVTLPLIKNSVTPSDEWSSLPNMVGTEFRLKVQQRPDAVVKGQTMKVFQYYSSLEDNLCPFEPIDNYVFFKISKIVAVACYGEVWTDQDTNIIRISEYFELSDKLKDYRGWQDLQIIITYGWLKQPDEPYRLVPLTIYVQGRNGKHIHWCRGQFTDYQMFSASAKILANGYAH